MNSRENLQCLIEIIKSYWLVLARKYNTTEKEQLSKLYKNVSTRATQMLNEKLFLSIHADVQFDRTHKALIILAIAVLVINFYVLVLVVRRRQLRRKTNYFVISLCCVDLLVGAFGLPWLLVRFKIMASVTLTTLSTLFMVSTIDYVSILLHGLLSCLNLLCVIGNRCFLFWYPFIHRIVFTKKNITVIVIFLWLISGILATIPLTWLHYLYLGKVTLCDIFHGTGKIKTIKNNDFVFILSICCILSALVFVESVFLICITLVIFKKRNFKESTPQRSMSCDLKQAAKATTILFGMFVCLLSLLTPFIYQNRMVDVFLSLWKSSDISTDDLHSILDSVKLYRILSIGRFLASALNPILFTMCKCDFKEMILQDTKKISNLISVPRRRARAKSLRQERKGGENVGSFSYCTESMPKTSL